jgi:serine/threonine protein kinase
MTSISPEHIELGGVAEVAARLGISRQQVLNLRSRPGFPEPLANLSSGPVFDMSQIELWSRSARPGPGRPSTKSRRLGGRFELQEQIGSGGYGEVWRAIDIQAAKDVEKVVAVKIMRHGSAEDRRRFRREYRILYENLHPNVIRVVDFSEDDSETLWYAMPLAKGNLDSEIPDLVPDGTLSDTFIQVLNGVEHLHRNRIIHRDLKPLNILLQSGGKWAISDLGLARDLGSQSTTLTLTGAGVGTPWYVAPEQWLDAKHVDIRADVFALGRILQECIAGYESDLKDVEHRGLRAVIRRATASDPEARYPDVASLRQGFERAISSPAGHWTPPADQRLEAAQGLVERLRVPLPDPAAIQAVAQLLDHLSDEPESIEILEQVAPYLDEPSLEELWNPHKEAWLLFLDVLARRLIDRETDFSFEFTDVIANFLRRLLEVAGDTGVLARTMKVLAEMGARYNRWHVRDLFAAILQSIRSADRALPVLEALQEIDDYSVAWSVQEIELETLHPTLRDGIKILISAETV